jgi:GT2 family glycosyltransferase
MKNIGILFDNISGNTGDVAIGLSVKKILADIGVRYEELIPGNFNPQKYDTILIGGGHILRPSPDFFYDKFKVPGAHILNAAGVVGNPVDLQYLKDYEYVTVRSCGDKKRLAGIDADVRVVPCTSMLLPDEKNLPFYPKKHSIGIHFNPAPFSPDEERLFISWASSLPYTIYFLPITHFTRDYVYLEKLASLIDNSVILPILKPQEISTLIGHFDHFISSSLHGAIFSYVHNVPFLLWEVNDKMRFFMDDRKLGRYLFKGFEDMKSAFESMARDPPDYSKPLSSDLRTLDAHISRLKEILPASGDSGSAASVDHSSQEAQHIQQLHLQAIYNEFRIGALEYQNKQLAEHARGLEKRVEIMDGGTIRPVHAIRRTFRHLRTWGTASAQRLSGLYGPAVSIPGMAGMRLPPGEEYAQWVKNHEPGDDELAQIRDRSRCFSHCPLISIIMDACAPGGQLRNAIKTVLDQAYDHWELCIAVNSGSQTLKPLEEMAGRDTRIKLKTVTGQFDTAKRMNDAASFSSGEFICFMDGRDELAPFALYEVVRALDRHPGLDYIYSDNDHLDGAGIRFGPDFKPDWSPDLLMSCWYTGHLEAFRKRALEGIGYYRKGFGDSYGYDLTLRFTERLTPDKIGHIQKILYHRRSIKRSVDGGGIKAVSEALDRRGEQGLVSEGYWPGSYRVKRAILGDPMVSIIILTKNNPVKLKNCIESIRQKTTYKNYEIVLVDHVRDDPASADISGHQGCTVIKYTDEFNFSRMNNIAAARSHGSYLIFLNDDTEVLEPQWIEAMLEHAGRPGVGAVGCKLLYPDASIQHAGVVTGMGPDPVTGLAGHIFKSSPPGDHGYFGLIDVIRDYSAVTAAAMMIRKDIFMGIGGFEEQLPVSYNDVDLCLQLRARGFLIVYTPYATLLHHESSTLRTARVRDDAHDVMYLHYKWGKTLKNDPYYNPNLSLRSTRCDLNV